MPDLPELPPVIKNKGFKLVKHVGSGGFAEVYKATSSKKELEGKELAAKIINLSKANPVWVMKNLKNEMKISNALKHPNVIRVYDLVKTSSSAYIFMDFAKNGSIGENLQKTKKPLSESKVKKYMKDIVNGMVYIHSRGVAHRDIKPDNFLIDSDDKIMISDFGFACIGLENSEPLMKGTGCGTKEYTAIEIKLKADGQAYDAKAADMYSLGIALYEMLFFVYPFDYSNQTESIRKQKARDYKYMSKVNNISEDLKELIFALLDPNPKIRPTARDVQRCRWLTSD